VPPKQKVYNLFEGESLRKQPGLQAAIVNCPSAITIQISRKYLLNVDCNSSELTLLLKPADAKNVAKKDA
jgi:hypothetical protein